ncbi:hypothetical protein Hdeb2414_s0013g00416891 [Helianthus debilis subsp. tardiflorus]
MKVEEVEQEYKTTPTSSVLASVLEQEYIPTKSYTKRTYITLLTEKFGGSGAPPRPLNPAPLVFIYLLQSEACNKGIA